MEGQQMRLRASISCSLSHQKGMNQSDALSLIYAPNLCAEYMSSCMDAHAVPPKVRL